MKYIECNNYIKLTDIQPITYTCIVITNPFMIDKHWYMRFEICDDIKKIDSQCERYLQQRNLKFRSCNIENVVLVKIPYRYKRFEVSCENCTLYSDLQNNHVTITIEPVALYLINESYVCTFIFLSYKIEFMNIFIKMNKGYTCTSSDYDNDVLYENLTKR